MSFKNKILLFVNFGLWLGVFGGFYTEAGVHQKKFNNTDSEIRPFVKEIVRLSEGKIQQRTINTIKMGFSQLGYSLKKKDIGDMYSVGMCWHMSTYKEVEIDKQYWEDNSDMRRLFILLHETLHCYCDRKHLNGNFEDKCPISVMNPELPSEECDIKHYKEYINEAFQGC
jgi:hypothetical protein